MMQMDANVMPTSNADYSCHIKAIQPITWDLYHTTSHHWLLIASGETHTNTYTCILMSARKQLKKPGVPSSKILIL